LNKLAQVPGYTLLVPTGTTPEGFYALLAEQPSTTFDGVTFYNLDEYCEPDGKGGYKLLDPEDDRSYQYYMAQHVLNAQPSIRSVFPGIENVDEPGTYDKLIAANGGIDLAINSIGEDGHTFGFNIPGSTFDSVTHLTELNEGTRAVNQGLTGQAVPAHAISAGISTGMQARQVITLLTGERKADILRKAVWDNVSIEIPATILRTHPNHLFVIDEAAASKL
jgi:glucosamine-6-phosphate deaminase